MDCLILIDIQKENEQVKGFGDIVEVSNTLSDSFRERGLPVVNFVHDMKQTGDDILPEKLNKPNIIFIREFFGSTLNSDKLMSFLDGIEEFKNFYICGYGIEDTIQKLVFQLLEKDKNCYLITDGILPITGEFTFTTEENMSMMIDEGAFSIQSNVITEMI